VESIPRSLRFFRRRFLGLKMGHLRHLRILIMFHMSIWLVVLTILKNMKVNGKEYPVYEMENNPNVGNHQPVILGLGILHV